jgi:hypothetical protein
MMYTIYDSTTGQILRVVNTNEIESQIGQGESFIEGEFDDVTYYIKNDTAVEIPPQPSQYSTFDFPTKQWVLTPDLAIADVLTARNKLLFSTDWTQIPNNPLTSEMQAEWATYRQQLRDIPQQSGYPYNVVWPVAPA